MTLKNVHIVVLGWIGVDNLNEKLLNSMGNLAKGADASEKVTLGIITLLGVGLVNPSKYTMVIFIIFLLFIIIHFLNIIFKPSSPKISDKNERICPHCQAQLEPLKFLCTNCKREFQ